MGVPKVNGEAARQMTEEGRKQWLSGHVSKGKAFESLEQAYRWMLARRKEDHILGRPEWTEPFYPNRPYGLITRAEGIRLLLMVLRMNREQAGLNLSVVEEEAKNELRWDINGLVQELDERFQMRRHFQEADGELDKLDREFALPESHRTAVDPEQRFTEYYRSRVRELTARSCFPGTPYLTDELELKINYTDTVATVLKCLVEAVAWNEIRVDREIHHRVEEAIVRCWTWIRDNHRDLDEGGIGWGWAGFVDDQGASRIRGRREEEIATVLSLDADRCRVQTYFNFQVITGLLRLYRLLKVQRVADDGHVAPHLVGVRLEIGEVRSYVERAVRGLLNSNRPTEGTGWHDVTPYPSSIGKLDVDLLIEPEGYDARLPSLLHTAYACCALAEVPVMSGGEIKLDDAARNELIASVRYILDELTRQRSFVFLRNQTLHKHVLSRSIGGNTVELDDECGIYVIFRAIAIYSYLSDPAHGLAAPGEYYQLSDEDNRPYFALARFILEEIRDRMYDRRGFPAIGALGRNDVDRFPAIRATARAIAGFEYFGLQQMVPGISRIVDKHLCKAKEEIILELVARYGELEKRGIRVAWGLIELDGLRISAERAEAEADPAGVEEQSQTPDPEPVPDGEGDEL